MTTALEGVNGYEVFTLTTTTSSNTASVSLPVFSQPQSVDSLLLDIKWLARDNNSTGVGLAGGNIEAMYSASGGSDTSGSGTVSRVGSGDTQLSGFDTGSGYGVATSASGGNVVISVSSTSPVVAWTLYVGQFQSQA